MDAEFQNHAKPLVVNRQASVVMKLARMGSFHQSRLSFMRVLLRRLKAEEWQFRQDKWDIDKHGVGVATYEAIGPQRTYTLVVFAHDLPDKKRSDRVIAEAWDATFTLHDGTISKDDIARLAANVPQQEAGRISHGCLHMRRRGDRTTSCDLYRQWSRSYGMLQNREQVEFASFSL